MTDQTPGPQVDEDNLECVRDFLRREFRGGRHEDYFDQATVNAEGRGRVLAAEDNAVNKKRMPRLLAPTS